MSEWQVSLIFQDSKSNKFWRARCIGPNLEVNFGRIGSQGQSQTKRYDSPEDAARERDKQAREKYKKGYIDGDGGASEAATSAAETAPAPPAASQCALVLTIGERRLELRLSVDGNALHTHSVEHYADSAAAEAAFAQIRAALEADGYRPQ